MQSQHLSVWICVQLASLDAIELNRVWMSVFMRSSMNLELGKIK
jgi:hypothetical protein